MRRRRRIAELLAATVVLATAACGGSAPETARVQSDEAAARATFVAVTDSTAPARSTGTAASVGTTASTTTMAADPPATEPAPTTSTLPPTLPKDDSVHPSNYVGCEDNVDVSDDGGAPLAGTPVTVPGFEDRPTLLQDGAGPEAPLVVLFHGQHGCVGNLQSRTDLDTIGNARGVNLLWLSGAPLPLRSWRANDRCCEPASNQRADDLGYLDAVFEVLAARGLGPRRVISAGVSNGAGMAITAACLRPNRFDAAVSVAGWMPVTCRVRKPLSVLVFGGTRDEVFKPWTPRSITSQWRKTATTCTQDPQVRTDEHRTITTWRRCSRNTVVRLVVLQDVPHVWPKYTFYDMDEEIIAMAHDDFA